MRLYRKIIPKIAREIVRTLHSKEQIEVEDGKMDEAELDLAAMMVTYMNEDDQLTAEAKSVMLRRGFSKDRLRQVRKSLADARGFKIGDQSLDYVIKQLMEALFASRNIAEIYADDNELRLLMKTVIDKYTSIDGEIEKEARSRLKNIVEGTSAWDIEFPRMVMQLKRQKGVI